MVSVRTNYPEAVVLANSTEYDRWGAQSWSKHLTDLLLTLSVTVNLASCPLCIYLYVCSQSLWLLPRHTSHTDQSTRRALGSSSISCSSATVMHRSSRGWKPLEIVFVWWGGCNASEYKDLRSLVFKSVQRVSGGTCVHIHKEPVSGHVVKCVKLHVYEG